MNIEREIAIEASAQLTNPQKLDHAARRAVALISASSAPSAVLRDIMQAFRAERTTFWRVVRQLPDRENKGRVRNDAKVFERYLETAYTWFEISQRERWRGLLHDYHVDNDEEG